MNRTSSRNLIFRPAFPDEESRAKYVAGDRSPAERSGWFVAVTEGPPERIVATIRYGRAPQAQDEPAGIDFGLTSGPGNELAGQMEDFLSAFTNFLGRDHRGKIRHLPLIPEGHPWDAAFVRAGFEPRYREYHLEARWEAFGARITKSYAALQRHPSPLQAGRPLSIRSQGPDEVISLLTRTGLMDEAGIRAIWETDDRGRLDRDASICFVLNGETLGVMLVADAGTELYILAIAVREEVPGTRLRVVPQMLNHLFTATARRGYERVRFRANAETAPTVRNFTLRAGGTTTADLRRWVKEIG